MLFTNRAIACQAAHLMFFVLLLATRPALAWDSLVGQESCDFVVSQIKAEEESATLIIAAFITGVNYATGREVDADAEEIAAWVRGFCERDPSARFLDALIELDKELDARLAPIEEPEAETEEPSALPGNESGDAGKK